MFLSAFYIFIKKQCFNILLVFYKKTKDIDQFWLQELGKMLQFRKQIKPSLFFVQQMDF